MMHLCAYKEDNSRECIQFSETMLQLLISLFFVAYATSASLPSSITLCKKNDDACATAAAQAVIKATHGGDKNLGMPVLDPLNIDGIHISGNGGSVDLEQTYSNIKLGGFKEVEFKSVKVKLDGSDCEVDLDLFVPSLSLVADMVVTGKLMLFTLNGEGPCNFTLHDLDTRIVSKCEKDGNGNAKFIETVIDIKPKKVTYVMPDIIKGNSELSANVISVMNENDMEIFGEIKKDYEKAFDEIIQSLINVVFTNIPIKDLFVD